MTAQRELTVQHPNPSITLRPYQEEAVAAVRAAWDRGVKRPLVVLPTGTGKTVLFAQLGKEHGYPILVVAHRDELLDQAADKFRQIDPGVSVGKVKADKNQMYTEVVTASIQTLARQNRLEAMPKNYYRSVVIDEAHHAPADSYQAVMDYFNGTPMLGVTATAERGDGSGLGGTFDELVYERDMLWAIREGYLADLRGVQIKLKGANLGRVKVSRGDFQDGSSGKMMSEAGAPHHALEAYLEHASDRKAIAFTPTVALAHEFADTFTEGGVPAAAVDASTPREERQAIYRKLRSGELRVVANAMVLTEGFDEPSVDCIIVARPTLSRQLYVQMIGRGTRLYPDKADCLVMDMVGVSDRLNLQTIPNLFGLPTAWMANGKATVMQAVTKQAEQPKQPPTEAELEATGIDLFTQRKFHWIKAGDRFMLNTGTGFVEVKNGGPNNTWSVTHHPRSGAVETLATGLDLGYAQGAAEDYVRRMGAEGLNRKDAPWRNRHASEKQIKALQRWGVPMIVRDEAGRLHAWLEGEDDELTAGRASDLMTERIAKKNMKRGAVAAPAVADTIVNYRKAGLGISAIANRLNAEHVATFGGGDKWYPITVRQALIQAMGKDAYDATVRRRAS